jgi:CRISPR system Cascade subunit CasD
VHFIGFSIHAPMASWGYDAIGEVRGTGDRPTRSALLGMIGAALGVRRDDTAGQRALAADYRVAVRVDEPGILSVDYHTTEVAPAVQVRRHTPPTRRALLELGDRKTILSTRSYREDSASRVILWSTEHPRWTLADLMGALRTPVFVLSAGRKSNPLAQSLGAVQIDAQTLREAFVQLDARAEASPVPQWRPLFHGSRSVDVEHDPCDGFESGLEWQATVERGDIPVHRERWHFRTRIAHVSRMDLDAARAP